MRPINTVGGTEAIAGHGTSTATAPAPQGAVPAQPPAGGMDSWEKKVTEELKSLRSLWANYKKKYLSPAISLARASSTKEEIDKAVNIEEWVNHIESLFNLAWSDLEDEIEARATGDHVNADIAARRVNEALAMLRVYAARWVK